MKPAPFRYVPVGTIAPALELKTQHGDEARFLAGGQSLVTAMNFRLIQPAVVIDVNPIAELSGISRTESGHLVIGALIRYRTIERDRPCQDDLW
jgi:CO/xanthine dehydrogenase FAD-binding subunit